MIQQNTKHKESPRPSTGYYQLEFVLIHGRGQFGGGNAIVGGRKLVGFVLGGHDRRREEGFRKKTSARGRDSAISRIFKYLREVIFDYSHDLRYLSVWGKTIACGQNPVQNPVGLVLIFRDFVSVVFSCRGLLSGNGTVGFGTGVEHHMESGTRNINWTKHGPCAGWGSIKSGAD